MHRFHVLTGGPGSGKTTLIEALAAAGYATSGEAGRAVIREQTATGGAALPWSDPLAFAERMLALDLEAHRRAQALRGAAFFDRGIPDIAGYLKLCRLPAPAHLEDAARRCRYSPRVFIAPPWREIYAQDAERKQDWDEAVRTCDAMVAAYAEYGYELVELPRASVDERVAFVLNAIAD